MLALADWLSKECPNHIISKSIESYLVDIQHALKTELLKVEAVALVEVGRNGFRVVIHLFVYQMRKINGTIREKKGPTHDLIARRQG